MKIIKEIGRNAQVDWIMVLLASTILAVVLAFDGIYLYNAVTKGDIQGSTVVSGSTSRNLDTKALSLVVSDFSARAETSRKIRAGYTGPGDPSL